MQDTQFKNQLIDIDLEGKTLPAVTAADEGKVLTVDSSGSWTAATGGGGGGLVLIEPTQEDDGLYLGYSFADIQAALGSGSVLAELKVTGNINFNICYLKVLGSNAGASYFAEFTNGHTFSAASQTDPLIYQST